MSLSVRRETVYCPGTSRSGTFAIELMQIKWVPQNVPTLIVGGSHDCITPLEIFKQDQRFLRDNIEIYNIIDAGHFPWFEQPSIIRDKFATFVID